MAEILVTTFYHYQWQNVLEQALAWAKYSGFEVASHTFVGRDSIQVRLRLPPGIDRLAVRQKLVDAMNPDGTSLYFLTEMDEPSPVEHPWWESLPGPDAQGNKVRIYAAEPAQVYQTAAFETYPVEGNTTQFAKRNDGALWMLVTNEGVDVWAKPAQGTQWLCVFRGVLRCLWVLARQMKSTAG